MTATILGMTGYYDFYTMGKFSGRGPNLIMFRIYKPDGSFGSCHCVEEDKAAANREALRKMGYQTASKA